MSDDPQPQSEPEGPIPAPSLDGAVDWLNVPAPVSMAELRGKVVILDFWTYGCVNCMHVLRDLKTLEERCQKIIAMLYLRVSAASYSEVAAEVGVGETSISPLRSRCLKKLEKLLAR